MKYLILFLAVSLMFFAGCDSGCSGGGGTTKGEIDPALIGTWKFEVPDSYIGYPFEEFYIFNANGTGMFYSYDKRNGGTQRNNLSWSAENENLCIIYKDGTGCYDYSISDDLLHFDFRYYKKTTEALPK